MPESRDAPPAPVRGRFAPSPTGPLHFGSLVCAVGSFLQARHRGGEWVLRIDDLDTPRVVKGAAASILRDLDALGLHWDGPVTYQSARRDAYEDALVRLDRSGLTYPCGCTRRELFGRLYPGTCRNGIPLGRQPRSVRVRTADVCVAFRDGVQGFYRQAVDAEIGDFVARRADGIYAYHLAAVVDDAAQGITEVVRGSDLLESTPPQVHLQRALGLATPTYAHLPVAMNNSGDKLGKQTGAAPIAEARPVPLLWRVLGFLEQQPPPELRAASLDTLWSWALTHWCLAAVPGVRGLVAAGV